MKVEGTMNQKDAGIVGKRLAAAAVIAAIGIAIGSACAGLALTLKLFLQ